MKEPVTLQAMFGLWKWPLMMRQHNISQPMCVHLYNGYLCYRPIPDITILLKLLFRFVKSMIGPNDCVTEVVLYCCIPNTFMCMTL
jgi:hypothetical protein